MLYIQARVGKEIERTCGPITAVFRSLFSVLMVWFITVIISHPWLPSAVNFGVSLIFKICWHLKSRSSPRVQSQSSPPDVLLSLEAWTGRRKTEKGEAASTHTEEEVSTSVVALRALPQCAIGKCYGIGNIVAAEGGWRVETKLMWGIPLKLARRFRARDSKGKLLQEWSWLQERCGTED